MALNLLEPDYGRLVGIESGDGFSREVTKYGSSPGQKAQGRDSRYARRHRIRGLSKWLVNRDGSSPLTRVETCGFHLGNDGLVSIKVRDGVAYPSGENVIFCGSIWTCPVCSAIIRARREADLEADATEWVARGGSLAMLTFTLRHNESMALLDVLNALLGSYRKLRHRQSFEKLRSLIVGQVRALEVTHGVNGWHPHLHLLLFLNAGVDEDTVRDLLASMITDWRALVESALGASPSVERAIDLTWFGNDAASAAKYIGKIAKEIALADTKSGRDPFALLDVMEPVEARQHCVGRFIEFAETMRGRHAMDYSPGLRALLGRGEMKSDEEVLDESVDGGDPIIAVVFGGQWNRYMRDGSAHRYLRWLEHFYSEVCRE